MIKILKLITFGWTSYINDKFTKPWPEGDAFLGLVNLAAFLVFWSLALFTTFAVLDTAYVPNKVTRAKVVDFRPADAANRGWITVLFKDVKGTERSATMRFGQFHYNKLVAVRDVGISYKVCRFSGQIYLSDVFMNIRDKKGPEVEFQNE